MKASAERGSLTLTVPGRPEPVCFEYFLASRDHILRILQGETYPCLPDIGHIATIVDIGANVGAASIMLAVKYPEARIHAFEPGPAPLELLRRNAAAFPSIAVHDFGLGTDDIQRPLYRSQWDPMSASLLTSAENTPLFDSVTVRRASHALAALDATVIDLLKIDTEGFEVPILEDLGQLVREIRAIYIEFHSDRDRLLLDKRLAETHLLAYAAVRHPHRGDVCYVHRDTAYARRHAILGIERGP